MAHRYFSVAVLSCLALTGLPVEAGNIRSEITYIGSGPFKGQKFQTERFSSAQVVKLAERACAKIAPSKTFVILQRKADATSNAPARFDFECFTGKELLNEPRIKETSQKKPASVLFN